MSAFRSPPSSILPRPGSGEWTPIIAILLLLAGLVAQLSLPSRTELPADSTVSPRRARAPAPALIPQYPAVLHAPIFAPDRAPGETSGSGGPGVAAQIQVLGVAAGGRVASAVVRDPAGASHVLTPGQSLQGWRLISVTQRGAVFAGPAGRVAVPIAPPAPSSGVQAGKPPSEP